MHKPAWTPRPPSALPRNLGLAHALLIACACLYPMTGWKASGLPAFDYLLAPWPRYFVAADLVFNILGYLPLGFMIAAALPQGWPALRTVLGATLLAALLSLGLETAQNFLPSRVASNLDVGANIGGALLGAIAGVRWGRRLFGHRNALRHWRARHIIGGLTGDTGLVLLGLWLLSQLGASNLLFASGDVRSLLGIPAALPFRPERFIAFEAGLTATSVLAIGLFARCMMRGSALWPTALLLTLGIAAKALATSTFFIAGSPLAWLTPGAGRGLAIGLCLLAAAMRLPRVLQHALAGMTLLATTALVNLMPDNPYLAYSHRLTHYSNFLSFHGLTQLTDSLWPFLALAYLSALGLWHGEHLNRPRPEPGPRL